MKRDKKNTKEWQLVLLWGLMISIFVASLNSGLIWLKMYEIQDRVSLYIAIAIVLWGFVFGVYSSLCKIKGKCTFLFKNLLIRKALFILLITLFIYSILSGIWFLYVDPIEWGGVFHKITTAWTGGIIWGVAFLVTPFLIGYLIAFIPMFLIRHALQLYRKYIKHILEHC